MSMPSRKSTSSVDAPPPLAPHPSATPDLASIMSFSSPNPNTDISMLSTASAPLPAALATSTPTTSSATKASQKPSSASISKQKEKDGADHVEGNKDKDTATPTPKEKEKEKEKDGVGIDDILLPRTLLSRLARGVLPPNTSISKDALLAITKASSVFISHLASTADELTTKKTIAPQDVLNALEEIEWGGLKGRCEGELKIWEEVNRGKRKGYRDRVKARESGVSNAADTTGGLGDESSRLLDGESMMDEDGNNTNNEIDEERAGKRARVDIDPAPSTTTTTDAPSSSAPTTNGTHRNGTVVEDQDQTEPEDEDAEEDDGAVEEVSSEEEEDEEEEDGEDGYGPEDQLRRDIMLNGNGDGGGGGGDEDSGMDSE